MIHKIMKYNREEPAYMKNIAKRRSALFPPLGRTGLLLLTLTSLLFNSCDHPEITLQKPNDVLRPAAEFVHNNFEFSLFYAAIKRAGLADELNGKGPLTILAPGDQAFNEIGILKPADFDRFSVDSLKSLVRLHVLNQLLTTDLIPKGTLDNRYVSASGMELWLSLSQNIYGYGLVSVNGAQLERDKYDIRLSNGIFHEINKVLKSSAYPIQDWMEREGNYKILIAGLKKFGLWDQLAAGNKQWTIMAPTDKVFEARGITTESIGQMDVRRYGKRLFGAYLFPARFFMTDLQFFSDRSFRYVESNGQIFTLNTWVSKAITGDEEYSNGVGNAGGGDEMLIVTKTFPLASDEPREIIRIAIGSYDSLPSRMDQVCSNAVLHQLDQVLLLPEETLIK